MRKKPDAPLSPYYINLRNLPNNLLTKVAEAIAESTRGINPVLVTGIPNAGDPIAQRYSEISGIPMLTLLDKAESSTGRKITAFSNAPRGCERWKNVLILDDLITEADTKFEAAETLEHLDYSVAGIAVLVDRQQGGRELLEANGYRVYAPILISKAFEYYYQTKKADWLQYAKSMDYLNQARSSAGLPKIILQ